jgi:putative membrane protein
MLKSLKYKNESLIAILVIFHLVGLVGMAIPSVREQILPLSAMNLYISFVVLILSRKSKFKLFFLFITISFLLGMIFEIIGVKTSFLFGEYYYGENLGKKVLDVPIVIGINWAVLAICSGNIIQKLKLNLLFSALLTSALMVLLDYLIEPIAIKNDYWHWKNENVPIYNYISWYFLSIPITLLYFKLKLHEQNKVSNVLYLILALFFIILKFI